MKQGRSRARHVQVCPRVCFRRRARAVVLGTRRSSTRTPRGEIRTLPSPTIDSGSSVVDGCSVRNPSRTWQNPNPTPAARRLRKSAVGGGAVRTSSTEDGEISWRIRSAGEMITGWDTNLHVAVQSPNKFHGSLFKWLTPFRRPLEGMRACDDRGGVLRRLRRITASLCLFGKRLCGRTLGPSLAHLSKYVFPQPL